jgi:carboxypeptidase Q
MRAGVWVGIALMAAAAAAGAGGADEDPAEAYRETAAKIVADATSSTFAWERLAVLTDSVGNRLSGTPQLDMAIRWALDEMKKDGLENVRADPVMVPKWVRGAESAEIVSPARHHIVMLGLGGSVGTPPAGIEAPTLVVSSFDDLEARSAAARGKIVVFNVPFTNYGQTVPYRATGASRAAQHGAVATLVRSVGPAGYRTPHTGGMGYTENIPKIPAAAITAEDADRLQRMQNRGTPAVVRLKMEAHFEPDVPSANVIGEIVGREKPEEIVLVGGHLDSWDVGAGATDDGGGCVATWEALRIVKKLGLRPRRTLRVVLFTNEENGTRGGSGYRDRYRDSLANHVLMLESDSGVFRPNGFGFSGNDKARSQVTAVARLLTAIGADRIGQSGGGADIGPSVLAANLPAMSLDVDQSLYFTIHHTPADTIDKINPNDMARSAAAVAVMAYVVADMPARLGQ